MMSWLTRTDAPELTKVDRVKSPKRSRTEESSMKSPTKGKTDRELNPITCKIGHSIHKNLTMPKFENTQQLFSPHKRRLYTFERRRRKLSFEQDMDPWFLIKFIREAFGHNAYDGQIVLPPNVSGKPSIVLDLDETLVHSCTGPLPDPNVVFTVDFSGQKFNVSAKFRPFLHEFLEEISKHYEITVFTASKAEYASVLLDIIDPNGYITHRLYRQSCTPICGNYIKDLRCLGRDLKKTIIVDNSPQTFAFQIYNGIPIISWYDDPEDDELERLKDLLIEIKDEDDFRVGLNEEFRCENIIKNLNKQEYLDFVCGYVD